MTTPWSHRIKGTHKSKGRKGDIIEYEPNEKAPIAVGLGAAEFFREKGLSPAIIELKVDDFSCSKKGDPLKKVFQNNNYYASGTITYFLRDTVADVVHEKQTSPYTVRFEDDLDEHGTPMMKITSFELK